MELLEYLSHNSSCPLCSEQTVITLRGDMTQLHNDHQLTTSNLIYSHAEFKKDKLAFNHTEFLFTFIRGIDPKFVESDAFRSFAISADGTTHFSKEFNYKFNITLYTACPAHHYLHTSRVIKISAKTPNITRGFPVQQEHVYFDKYYIHNDIKKSLTSISVNVAEDEWPAYDVVLKLPYMSLSSFPLKNSEKLKSKLDNMVLLA